MLAMSSLVAGPEGAAATLAAADDACAGAPKLATVPAPRASQTRTSTCEHNDRTPGV